LSFSDGFLFKLKCQVAAEQANFGNTFHADKLALSSMCAKITKIFQIFRNILKINLKCDFFTLHLQRLLHPLLSPSLKFRAAAKNAFLETHICWCVVIFAILRILILRLIDRGC